MSAKDTPLSPARAYFLAKWPDVLKPWSLPKAAARIHALLLSSPDAMSADDIMDMAQLSSGSTSTQLRFLIEVGLVDRLKILGSRKSRYQANRDPARIFTSLAEVRRRDAFQSLNSMGPAMSSIADQDDLAWLKTVWQLQALSTLMDQWLHLCSTKDPEWTVRLLQKTIEEENHNSDL